MATIDIHPSELERFRRVADFLMEVGRNHLRRQGFSEQWIENYYHLCHKRHTEMAWESVKQNFIKAGERRCWEVWRDDPRLTPAQVAEIDTLFEQYRQYRVHQECEAGWERSVAEHMVHDFGYNTVASEFWAEVRPRYISREVA